MRTMNEWILEIECGLHKDLCCLAEKVNPGLYFKIEEMKRSLSDMEVKMLIKLACECACHAPAATCPMPPAPTPPGTTPPAVTPPAVTPPATCPSPLNS